MYTLGFYLGMVGYQGHVGFKGVRFRIQLTNIPNLPSMLCKQIYLLVQPRHCYRNSGSKCKLAELMVPFWISSVFVGRASF